MSEADDIIHSLRTMKLIGEDETPFLTELTGGVSADIVLARTTSGPVCVKRSRRQLKVAGDWRASPSRNEAEKRWIRLANQLAPGAAPDILGEDPARFTFAMRYLDPERFRNWKALLRDGEVDGELAAGVGRVVGLIHRRTAGDPAVAEAFANDEDFADLRLHPYLATAAAANPDVSEVLQGLIRRTASTKLALVHGDLSPKNILVGPDGPVILDAECAWYGDPAFDPAFCLNHLLLKSVWRPLYGQRYLACADAFWGAYVEALGPAELGDVAARVATLLPGLMLARLDGKSPVEYLTDEAARQAVRRFAKETLLRPQAEAPALLDAWRGRFVQ